MKSFFFKSSLILLITLVFEISGFIFSYFKIIPRGSPAVISLFANKDWSIWHPTNIKFKHHYNTCWEPSEIFYNNIGARGKNNVYLTKEKKELLS